MSSMKAFEENASILTNLVSQVAAFLQGLGQALSRGMSQFHQFIAYNTDTILTLFANYESLKSLPIIELLANMKEDCMRILAYTEHTQCTNHPDKHYIKLPCEHVWCNRCLADSILQQTSYRNPDPSKMQMAVCPDCKDSLTPIPTKLISRCLMKDIYYYHKYQQSIINNSKKCIFCSNSGAVSSLHGGVHMVCVECFIKYLYGLNKGNYLTLNTAIKSVSLSIDPFHAIYCPFDLCHKKIKASVIGNMLCFHLKTLTKLKEFLFSKFDIKEADSEENFRTTYFANILEKN